MIRQSLPLDPHARSTLRDVMSPPEGYRLQHALATAYSIDAETLITIPLFAAGLGAQDIDKPLGIARVFELGAKLTLLVQGDRISISRRWSESRPLIKLVGDAVVACSIPGGSFHPKLTVLVFEPTEPGLQRMHRVVVATRNLTTDNSWDSVVVLDEMDGGKVVPGLAEAVSDLAVFVNDREHRAIQTCRSIAKALATATFQLPKGMKDVEVFLFHPGSRNAAKVLGQIRGDDLLVISPFVRKNVLDDLAARVGKDASHRWLVTRPVDVPESAFAQYQVSRIADGAVPRQAASLEEASSPAGAPSERHVRGRDTLAGLHAKIYIASSRKAGSRIVVTSANATPSGWERNVEVALTGVSSSKTLSVPALVAASPDFGTDAEKHRSFGDLLEPLTFEAVIAGEREPEWVHQVRSCLSGAVVSGTVIEGVPRTLELSIELPAQQPRWPERTTVEAHPFGYSGFRCLLARTSRGMAGIVTIEPRMELTPFLAVAVRCGGDPEFEVVLAMRLEGCFDWGRSDARAVLARAARPHLYRELLWYFGVRGKRIKSSPATPGVKDSGGSAGDSLSLPILERILLKVHGPNAAAEIETIDGLLAGVSDDDYPGLAEVWQLVKASAT